MIERGIVVPPPAKVPESYEVRIRFAVGDTVSLVGHNGRGDPMIEVRMSRHHMSPAIVTRVESWCRSHDDTPDITLLP